MSRLTDPVRHGFNSVDWAVKPQIKQINAYCTDGKNSYCTQLGCSGEGGGEWDRVPHNRTSPLLSLVSFNNFFTH